MEDPKVLTIAELLRLGRPLTATNSLHSPDRARPLSPKLSVLKYQRSKPSCRPPSPPGPTGSNPNPKLLTPLNYPAIIVGTVTLPTNDSAFAPNPTLCCPYNNCFRFSDTSATICCDIIDLDLRILGKEIDVLAWNFVPVKRGAGFLEIIKWGFPQSSGGLGRCSNVDLFPLVSGSSSSSEDSSKARYRIHGLLESVSPVTLDPCYMGLNSSTPVNLRGFLLQVMACECKLCTCKTTAMALNDSIQEQGRSRSHSYNKAWFVYFCGSASSWHPVFMKLIGNAITLLGLKKKLIYFNKEDSHLMYVTTEKSTLHLPRLSNNRVPCERSVIKGKGECGSYKGIIRGVYMQGMVVELDNEVWLLLTDHIISQPHSLRVGAIISVRNVHFVNPRFSWKKMLILGACFKTNIIVEAFSPLEAGCHTVSQSESMLGKFVASLAFSARLWVLLLISCLRKKFAGTISEKKILGTKHKEGLAQVYASLHLPTSVFLSRHGVFMETFKHNHCGCGSELYSDSLKLVIPISCFFHHCEATWMRILQLKSDCKKLCVNNLFSLQSCEGRLYDRSVRKILTSDDIGIILLGSLKISPSSGRLQLVDVTGSIDVLIPDLPSTWNANSIYEVIHYRLVIEGAPNLVDRLGLLDNGPFSCRSIFQRISPAREINLTVYIYFHWAEVTRKNLPFYPSIDWKDDLKKLEGGTFHLLYVTHKFPVPYKVHGDPAIPDRSSLYVEALVLPWDLYFVEEGLVNLEKVSGEQLEECPEHSANENYERVSLKRRKSDHALIRASSSGVMLEFCKSSSELSARSYSSTQSNEEPRCCNSNSYEISCLVTVRGVNGNRAVSSGIMHCTRLNLNTGGSCRSSMQKVLLEFKSESFVKYQLLQIGGHYITRHHRDDLFCNFKAVSGVKVHVTSEAHLWSLSYASDGVIPENNSSYYPTLNSFFRNNEVLSEDRIELQVSTQNSLRTCSDVHLCFPAHLIGLFEENIKGLEEGLAKATLTTKELANASLSIGSPNCLFPEGKFSSLQGQVVSVHSTDDSSIDVLLSHENSDAPQSRSFQRTIHSFCIHVLVDNHVVRIFGSLNKYAYPIGFGPGTYATFHRVLELWSKNSFMLTPVTYIVINSISAVSEPCSDSYPSFQPIRDVYSNASPDTLSSGQFSELSQCSDCKPMRFHCRVVAIHILVLEKVKYDGLPSKDVSRPPVFDIPLACFVLDDGSSSCRCWANAKRASTMLRLHEKLPQRAFESSDWTQKWAGIDDNACSSAIHHLERIFKNHDRITVKNFGSMFDSSYQDLAVSTSSDNGLSALDESLLKFMILNASFSSSWTVIASVIDLKAVWQLGKEHLTEMKMTVDAMQNICAMEVCYTNPLADGRNMIQELLNR
ncbi:hypothetical protein I3842_15G062100 [Carya illinoinensis]|uniref:CST complex subunit CTC1 n=1 Tax=Carya illinoinensis TaxID=32201 RepID=A0A922A6G4_CARIL|nr:hypothetical protein I3842_15G062100 [Carya illinoinensis]